MGTTGDDLARRHAWAGEVDGLVQRLDPLPRAALRLSYVHRLTPAEIAARLVLPTGEVRRLLSAALVGLGDALGAPTAT